jgi:hypothetical protein
VRKFTGTLACALFLACECPLPAQEQLKIEVREGGTTVLHPGELGDPICVVVRDELGRPVPGAHIELALPGKDKPSLIRGGAPPILTKEDGSACTEALRANHNTGQITISLAAEFQGKQGTADLKLVNERRSRTKRFVVLATALAGAGVAGYLVARRGPPQATITTATPTGAVGHP